MKHRVNRGLVVLAVLAVSGMSCTVNKKSEFDAFLETYTTTWNTRDGDALASLFAPDADLIMGNLPRIAGREAIGGWWDTYFSRIDEGRRGEFELLSLKGIAPGVQVVNIGSKTFGTNLHGEELETRLARGTWVIVEEDGTWLIAAMRGLPAEGEQRLRPGEDR